MAIVQQVINGSFTEIYISGGGNWMTQAAPTNIHQFYKRKVLTADETAADFREVTPSQKTQLESSDAKWTEPSAEFVAEAEGAGAVYNRATGYFELNGLTDLTETEMRTILPYMTLGKMGGSLEMRFCRVPIRTVTIYVEGAATRDSMSLAMAFYVSSLSTIRFVIRDRNVTKVQPRYILNAFRYCTLLRTIYGVIDLANISGSTNAFEACFALEDVNLSGIKASIALRDSPNLSLDSITYMVENAANTAPITITLHGTVYGRLTDELIAAAQQKQITFVTT